MAQEDDGFLDAMATVVMERGFLCNEDRKKVEATKRNIDALRRQLAKLNARTEKVIAAQQDFQNEFGKHVEYKTKQLEMFQPVGSINPDFYDTESSDLLIPLYDSLVKEELIKHFHTAVDRQLSSLPSKANAPIRARAEIPKCEVLQVYKANCPPHLQKQYDSYVGQKLMKYTDCPHPSNMNHVRQCGRGQYLLYHGCDWYTVDKIITDGFRKELSSEMRRSLFGKKVYFADLSSKSGCYVRSDTGSNQGVGKYRMIVARVFIGKTYYTRRAMYDAVEDPDDHDSVTALTKELNGGCVHYPEYMIGNNLAAIPEYVIEFVHKDECRCSQCELRFGS